jgi:hypothetical protein
MFEKKLDKFVSLHVHKCGGTTFAWMLMDLYGEQFFWDRSEDSVFVHGHIKYYNQAHVQKTDVVHGHIHADKYSFLKRPFITWLRHPVARLESEYSIIKQKRITGKSSPLHKDVILKKLSFTDYCERISNVYTNYVGDLRVKDLAFVGITEYYEESLFVFSQLVGKEIPPYYRRNTRRLPRQWFKQGTADEKRMCASHNQKDIVYYMEARKRLISEFKSCLSLYVPGQCAPRRKR